MKQFRSHGSGKFEKCDFAQCGNNVIFEPDVLVFHPESIFLGDNIYIGHQSILKGYYKNKMVIGNDTWIGQQCFLHSAGGISIGNGVGIAPCVRILTSFHETPNRDKYIMEGELVFASVEIKDGCDIGVGAVILPGVQIGEGVQVGAGAVVTKSLPPFSIAAGIPAKILRMR